MAIVNIQLPLDSVARIVIALERIATAAENLSAYICVPIPEPVYTKDKRHISEPNHALIADIEALNEDRKRRGLMPLDVNEAAAHLKNDVV